jgi:hypothetical protein
LIVDCWRGQESKRGVNATETKTQNTKLLQNWFQTSTSQLYQNRRPTPTQHVARPLGIVQDAP